MAGSTEVAARGRRGVESKPLRSGAMMPDLSKSQGQGDTWVSMIELL
jgi:hypothetical protein